MWHLLAGMSRRGALVSSRYSASDVLSPKHEPGLAAGHVREGEGGVAMAAPGTVESGAWLAPCCIVHKSYRI